MRIYGADSIDLDGINWMQTCSQLRCWISSTFVKRSHGKPVIELLDVAGSPAIPQHVPTTCSADHIPNLQAEKRGRSGQLLRFQLLHQQLLQVY